LLEAYEVAARASPEDAELHSILGVLNLMRGDRESAILCFSAASFISPENHTVLNRLSAALIGVGHYSKAVESLYTALELRPGYVRAWGNLALASYNLKDYALAARNYLCAIAINPQATHLWSRVASCFSMLGNP
jgi:peroxin-5